MFNLFEIIIKNVGGGAAPFFAAAAAPRLSPLSFFAFFFVAGISETIIDIIANKNFFLFPSLNTEYVGEQNPRRHVRNHLKLMLLYKFKLHEEIVTHCFEAQGPRPGRPRRPRRR